ncbi:MAG: hypothetical protein JSU07_08930 [Bacteroidetes bacterium]|nr:hypothetical protein [Bacteroidota bacterium]
MQNNLIVGGGVIITDKVHAAITVTASTLRADSLMLNSAKGIYGTTNINGDVFANNKLTVSGNAVFGGNLKVAGLSGTVTSNVYIDASGNLQRGAPINSSWACASTPNWNLGGNNFGSAAYVGVTDANIGTCDAYDFILKSFNTNRAWFQTDGTMSFGARITSNTGGPEFRVYQAAVRLSGSNTFGGPMLVLGGTISPYGDWGMEYTGGTSASQAGLNFWKPYASSNANNNILFLHDNNRVGIGTDNPSARLTIDAWTDDGLLVKCDNSGNPATVKNAIDVYDKTNNIVQFRVKSNGVVYSREVYVQLGSFPDYVFTKEYKLPSISETKQFVLTHQHLKNMPTAAKIKNNGASLGEIQKITVEKLEEAYLYIFQLEEKLNNLTEKLNKIEQE